MRKLVVATLALFLLVTGYIASPLLAAWSIREAVRAGNSDYLRAKIEWDSVRATMRQSLAVASLDLQVPTPGVAERHRVATKPGMWQRLKTYFKARAVNGIVDSYVTPEGLPQLFSYRKVYRERVLGEPDEATLPWMQRFSRFWSRVKRAEFHAPHQFEIEMADRDDPNRRYIGLLELRGMEWKLTSLRVRLAGPPPADPAGAG
jgi:hypothetical protein